MATSIDHYLAAQDLLRRADALSPHAAAEQAPLLLQRAQVQATLALAAAAGLDADFGMPVADRLGWREVASVEAPIPPEGDDEAEGGAVHVGAVSPPPSLADPEGLGAWLRALPDGTILRGAKGLGWQIGPITVYRALLPSLEYRAISTMAGEHFEITEGCADLDKLVVAAPFTVLALGEPQDEESQDDPRVSNTVTGTVGGAVVQAGDIDGGLHFGTRVGG